jgi:glycosyltransferase involved in cell wall biosynthesis
MPSVSVIIPTCDRPDMLAEALESVGRQSRAADEVVVVDNSTVPVPEKLMAHAPGVRLERIPPRSGVSFARNWGAWRATGDTLAFLDDDDLWPSDYLAAMLQRLDATGAALIAAPQRLSDTNAEVDRPLLPDSQGRFARWARLGYRGSNMLVRADAFWAVHGFPTRLPTGEDRAFVIAFAAAGYPITVCTATHALKREHSGPQLTDRATLALGKLSFLAEFAERMPEADIKEDRLAVVINLSRLWGWPLWLVGAAMAPAAAFRRLRKFLPTRADRRDAPSDAPEA